MLRGNIAVGMMALCVSILLLAPLLPVSAEDRAMYQVDATNSGFYEGSSSNFTYSPIPIWEEESSFTSYSNPILIDINDDDVKDIIYAGGNGVLKVMSGDYTPLWEFQTSADEISTPAAADIDKDDDIEIVFVANEEEPKLYCLGWEGIEKWNLTLPSFSKVAFPTIADVTNDYGLEILISAGQTPKGIATSTSLFCVDSDGKELWEYFDSELFFDVTSTPVVADIYDDAAPEIIFGVTGNAGVFVLDNDGDEIWTQNPGFRYTTPIVANIDKTGRPEVIIGVDSSLYCYSNSGTERWHTDLAEPLFSTPFAKDIDGDGNIEILAASDKLYCFDMNGTEKWNATLNEKVHYSSIAYGDIDSGLGEILIGDIDGYLYSFSGTGEKNWEVQYGTGIQSSPVIADVNGDGTPELFLTIERGDYAITSFLDLPLSEIVPEVDFELGSVSMQPSIPVDAHEVTFSTEVFNRGNVFSSTELNLVIDNSTVDSQFIAISPGSSQEVTLSWTGETGDHRVEVMVDPYHNVNETREDNNEFSNDFTVIAEFIDIIVEKKDITVTQIEDTAFYRLSFVVQNIGNLPTGNFSVKLSINGEEETLTDITLDPVSETIKFKTLPIEGVDSYLISVEADPEDRVSETNETNNLADLIHTVTPVEENGGDDDFPPDDLYFLLFLIPIIVLGLIIYFNNRSAAKNNELMQNTLDELRKSLILAQTRDAATAPPPPPSSYAQPPVQLTPQHPQTPPPAPESPPPNVDEARDPEPSTQREGSPPRSSEHPPEETPSNTSELPPGEIDPDQPRTGQ